MTVDDDQPWEILSTALHRQVRSISSANRRALPLSKGGILAAECPRRHAVNLKS